MNTMPEEDKFSGISLWAKVQLRRKWNVKLVVGEECKPVKLPMHFPAECTWLVPKCWRPCLWYCGRGGEGRPPGTT